MTRRRFLVGGLWQNVVEEGGQGNGSIVKYTGDLTTVQTGLDGGSQRRAILPAPRSATFRPFCPTSRRRLSAANASVSGGGSFGSVAAAETALHDSHVDILNVVNNDPTLAGLAAQNGATGFTAVPAALPAGTTAAERARTPISRRSAPSSTTRRISILGGVNADNAGAITSDVNAVVTDMQALDSSQPDCCSAA